MLVVAGLCGRAAAKQVKLDVSLAHPTLLAGAPQTTYVKVGLIGPAVSSAGRRAPVNVALVLDKSGSMTGTKIVQAKNAAIHALDRLNENDIVSVIVYDASVQIVVPATKLTDKAELRRAIAGIEAGGSTALFAGVSKGAAEVRKFLDRNRVNRVILLSDGRANVGPSTPGMLGDLGASLMKEGISVSTLGLGLDYNEDLMVELARRSDGNHMFVEAATALAAVFDHEFQDALSVAAQEVAITIRCAPGIRPVRLLGIDGEINGREVIVRLNQLYGGQEKYALLEIEVPESEAGQTRPIADVEVSYANMQTKTTDQLSSGISVYFDPSTRVVQDRVNVKVMAECVLQIANERNEQAVALRDRGQTQQAKALLELNATYLSQNALELKSDKLQKRAMDNVEQSQGLDPEEWKRTRKISRYLQYEDARQQRALPPSTND
jgi:Ca-activated chloride channel family protein